MKRTLLAFLLAASVLMPQAAFAQQTTVGAKAEKAEPKAAYGPGDIDILLSLGLGAFLYPHAEPAIDIGVVPIGDMTISVGGGMDIGWCALCALTSAVSGVTIASQYFAPFGRVNLHLGTLGGALDASVEDGQFTIDPYAGIFGGPTLYRWTFKFDNDTANAQSTSTSLLFGPAAGVRLGLAKNRVLITGEFRFNVEIGFGQVTVEDSEGNVYYDNVRGFNRAGTDFILGIGFRI